MYKNLIASINYRYMDRVKKAPRLSVTKFAEYSVANPLRRKSIVRMAKEPKSFVVTRYREARFFAKEFFKSGFNTKVLDLGIQKIGAKTTRTDFEQNDQKKSIEALEMLKAMSFSCLKLGNCVATDYRGANPKLSVGGTMISVFPDLVLHGRYRGKKVAGVVKFHFSSSNQLNEDASLNACVILHDFAQKFVAMSDEKAVQKLCIMIDPFAGVIKTAPLGVIRRGNSLEAAGEEVKFWWNVA